MTDIFQTIMINFGMVKYTGDDLEQAKAIAVKTGFECSILKNGSLVMRYAPIGGWRTYNA